ncbi:transposase [Cryptosporangium sp. NPDC048952]|uniref:transposase n=1 Tax=Cryptosporangium sp. NPDC048952 TaxID=3363961 RepID=UPI003716122C
MVVLSASRTELIPVFTGLSERQFRRLVATVARRGGDLVADGRPGRPWCLPLADRVLLVAVYYRTNLTMRQVAPLFGIRQAAVHRIIDRLAPLLTLSPVTRRHSPERVLIVDGTLVPVRDQSISARSKNYRYSVNVQVVIDADTHLVVAAGDPVAGNRNDCTAYQDSGAAWATRGATVIADGAYRGPRCAGVVIPHRRNRDKTPLPDWKEDHNRSHRHVRARIEHVFARMKNWKILRDCRRRGTGAAHAVRGIAFMHNLATTI